MIPLEVGNLNGLVIMLCSIMLGPPILFAIIGYFLYKNHPKTAKVLFILGGIYLIIGLGICGGLISNS